MNLLSYSSNSLYRFSCDKEGVSFSVFTRSIEFNNSKEIRISYFHDINGWSTLRLIKEFTELDDANYFMENNNGDVYEYPISNDVVFNLNVSNFPITLYPSTYNAMMQNLDKVPYNIFFNMDI